MSAARLSTAAYYPDAVNAQDAALMIATLAYERYRATLVGNPAPIVAEMFERITHPQPGELVLETTTWRRSQPPGDRLGVLLFVCGRKPRTEEEWAEAEAAGFWKMERAHIYPSHGPWHYIDPIDGVSQRTAWENASFISAAATLPKPSTPPIPKGKK